MNYGRFFRLNTENSDLSKGITIFDYIWLKDESASANETPKYPIYVVITKECVEFKCHFYDGKMHVHNSILSLPLSANLEVKDGLTKALIEGYNTAFPSLENDYLCPLLISAILKDEDKTSYSGLTKFKIQDEASYAKIKDNLNNDVDAIYVNLKTERYSINWFIRKLILDFLFDLEHTKVFQNSPYYEHISVKLKENFFFNALANKAMYYHCRDIAAEEDRKLFFLKNNFLPAEEQWVKSITSPKADEAFNLKPQGWFEIPEKEMTNLQDPKEEKAENVISYFERNKSSVNNNGIEKRIKKLAKNSSKWQLKKYDFLHGMPVFSWFMTSFISLVIMLLSLSIASENMNNFIKRKGLIAIIVIAIVLIAIFLVEIHCKSKLRYAKKLYFFLPRLLGSIIGGWLMIAFASNVLPQFYAIVFKGDLIWRNLLIVAFLLFLIYLYISDEVSRGIPYITAFWQKFKRILPLMFIAFCYSYFIGIITSALIGTEHTLQGLSNCEDNFIILNWGNSINYISPGFLLVFTIVAMFIGLFINRIFEDKQIVDSE